MNYIQNHLEFLGRKVTDRVTNFKGIVTTVSFDLYGCIQVVVTPVVNKEGRQPDSHWFDINRLVLSTKKPVMQRPDFSLGPQAEGKTGPAEKPPL